MWNWHAFNSSSAHSIYIHFFSSVAAIIGHLFFFLKKDSSTTLEQAIQIYHQSTSDVSVKQAVEHLFEGYPPVNHGISNLFKPPHVDHMLVEEAIQIALNNRLCMISYFTFELVLIKNIANK